MNRKFSNNLSYTTPQSGMMVAVIKRRIGQGQSEMAKKMFCTSSVGAILERIWWGMKKFVLIITLSVFGATTVATAPFGGDVVVAQKRDKDDKKNAPGPPVIKDKGPQDKSKQPPPKKDKKP